jgi:5'-3' exonuclease
MKNNNNNNGTSIIYGLDADLIFLALSSNIDKTYLLRETTEIETKKENLTNLDEFSYIDIDILKEIICKEMTKYNNNIKEKHDIKKLVDDFIFLCYLCGNDFLPNIPSLSISINMPNTKNGLELIFNTYSIIQKNIYETSNILQYILDITEINNNRKCIKFNNKMLIDIFEILSNYEETYLKNLYNYKKNNFYDNETNYENEIYNLENLNFKIEDNVQLGNANLKLEDYKRNYYLEYYHLDIDKNYLDYQFKCYITGLVWTSFYYFDKCVDWFYYYKYHHGPFMSDIYNYLKKNENIFNNISKYYTGEEFYANKLKPLHQLLLVLPKKSSNLLPASFKTLLFSKKLLKYFPDDIKIDYLYKNKLWQSIMMIDTINPEIIINSCDNLILNDSDKGRNSNYYPFIKEY